MHRLYGEFRDLLDGPEVLAIGIICLAFAASDFVCLNLVRDPGAVTYRLWRLAAGAHLEELVAKLEWVWPWLR